MKTKLVLYRPPGTVVPYLISLSSLNDSIDSCGNQHAVHHARRQQFVGLRRRLERHVHAQRLADVVDHAAADAELDAVQVVQRLDRPLGVEDDAGAVREHGDHLQAAVLVELGQVLLVDALVGDAGGRSALSPRNGNSAILVSV